MKKAYDATVTEWNSDGIEKKEKYCTENIGEGDGKRPQIIEKIRQNEIQKPVFKYNFKMRIFSRLGSLLLVGSRRRGWRRYWRWSRRLRLGIQTFTCSPASTGDVV